MGWTHFNFRNAGSIEEAVDILRRCEGRAAVIGGGTDLLHGMKDHIYSENPGMVVNLSSVPEGDYIEQNGDGVRIGALTTLRSIEKSELVNQTYPVLAQAARAVASPQIRNSGTIAGNICQEPRCWYYRKCDNLFPCLRKGGALCNAFTGQNQFHSVFGVVHAATPPCQANCPAGNAIPAYFSKIRAGDFAGAAQILLQTNPMPAVTGRVCPHACEGGCNREQFDEAVSIRAIERKIGDMILQEHSAFFARPEKESGKNVAVVGAGPAGLSAAYYLRKNGHGVTIFDKLPQPGGMLRYGIPAYRLPKDVVDKQAQILSEMGVQFKLSTSIGEDVSIKQLSEEFNAVLLACGAWDERPLGIEGEDCAISGLGFLNEVGLGRQARINGTVAVIGAGNVAMDVARTLVRLGAKPIVLYRRTRSEMPAIAEDVEKAEEEGIEFQYLTTPVAARRADGKIALRCIKLKLGERDASGRPRPVPIEGSEFELKFDIVMKAIGEQPDSSLMPFGIKLNSKAAYSTLGDGVFAGGDFLSGPSTVVAALKAGREVAGLIDQYLQVGIAQPSAATNGAGRALESFGRMALEKTPRRHAPELAVGERIATMDLEEAGSLTWAEVGEEANRCHNCGCVASSPSDTAPALIVLDAKIKTTKRVIAAEEFFAAKVTKSTVLESDELVTEVLLPEPKANTKGGFVKYRQRQAIDFPIVAAAATVTYEGGRIKNARIALGAVAPIPLRAKEAEGFLQGKELTEAVAQTASEIAVKGAIALGRNHYKIQVTKALVKRALLACRR